MELESPHPFQAREERYDELCRSLNLDEETRKIGWSLLRRLTLKAGQQDEERFVLCMAACALYVAGMPEQRTPASTTSGGSCVSLTQLLRATHIRLVDFFDPLKAFIANLKLGAAYEEQLLQLERKFCVICILYRKYEKEFFQVFRITDIQPGSPDSPYYALFSFGWVLFLVAKGKLLTSPPDLITAFHLLLCCVQFVATHAAPETKSTLTGTSGEVALAALCKQSGASLAEVVRLEADLFAPFLQSWKDSNVLGATGDSLAFDRPTLKRWSTMMARDYEIMFHSQGDFDERLFLTAPQEVGTPSRVGENYGHYYDYDKGVVKPAAAAATSTSTTTSAATAQPTTPSASSSSVSTSSTLGGGGGYPTTPGGSAAAPPRTPMRAALSAVAWLKSTLEHTQAAPSPVLRKFFAACENNPAEEIEARVAKYSGLVPFGEGEEGQQRRELGIKLYYKILEAMLLAEEERLKRASVSSDFSTLLRHDSFHRSLLACCFEVIAYCYKIIDLAFPKLLSLFHIHAFDFFKLIESVIRYERTLPVGVTRHLGHIEETILESVGWQEGSPVFALLADPAKVRDLLALFRRPTQGGAKEFMASSALSPPSPAPNMLVSPARPTAPATPGRGGMGGSWHSLCLFYRKVLGQASRRCWSLCAAIGLRPEVFDQVWRATIELLISHANFIKGRHLDQIILCVIYGVSRVNKVKDVAFRGILEHYRKQPHRKPAAEVYRAVPLNEPGEKGDIIKFYNFVFIPQLESFLLQFQAAPSSTTSMTSSPLPPLSPHPTGGGAPSSGSGSVLVSSSSGSYALAQSPVRVAASNVYLSPMHPSSGPRSLTHPSSSSSSSTYSFGLSPSTKELHAINATLNSPVRPVKREREPRRLLFPGGAGGEPAPAPEGDGSALRRKLSELASAAAICAGGEGEQPTPTTPTAAAAPTPAAAEGSPRQAKRRRRDTAGSQDNSTGGDGDGDKEGSEGASPSSE